MVDKRYARRSSAIRAAKIACKTALDAPQYQAAQSVDFIIRIHHWYVGGPEQMDDEYSFELIGVCLEAAEAKAKDPTYVYQP
ncbi:hypothetical protein [Mesorhizobium sp.]|uniref:hypothetical protein n=1 Tax=Mesorhizobium sp. TaxID=1871066 RepID=UPI001209586D|nr:hypothetical protein [Mesorhizobium sp.]TIX28851.1 MAG: hypothetical protein E5V35_00385 [Mesorhizobium sp.]